MSDRYDYVFGLDIGVQTGFACWNVKEKKFVFIRTEMAHNVLIKLHWWSERGVKILVRIEDPNTWVPFQGKTKAEHSKKLQGAGSIKRDFSFMVDALNDWKVPAEAFKLQGTLKKLDVVTFKVMTKWDQRTSEHALDAAMMCWEHDGFIKPLKPLRQKK